MGRLLVSPRVSPCEPLCALLLAKASVYTRFHPKKRTWAVCAGGVEGRVINVLETLV